MVALTAALGWTGCMLPDYNGGLPEIPEMLDVPEQEETPRKTASRRASADAEDSEAQPSSKTADSKPDDVDEQALGDLMAELDEIGALDPEMKKQLIDDLRKSKPALWRPTIEAYRAALAHRERLAKREPTLLATPREGVDLPPELSVTPAAATQEPPAEEKPSAPADAQLDLDDSAAEEPSDNDSASKTVEPAAALETADPAAPATEVEAPSAESSPRRVVPAPHVAAEEVESRDWQDDLNLAIAGLEKQSPEAPRTAEEVRGQAALRMLYLVANRRDDALRPIAGISPTQQDFWTKQLYGLATFVDSERNADAGGRAAEARRHLTEAAAKLGELSTLSVHNLAFCSEVKSYGVYKKFDQYEFQPGEEVLLYAEIENFKCDATEKGYQTSLRSSYQILDSRGTRVADHDFSTTEDTCLNPRRDFFMRWFVWMPKRIYEGAYTLQLTIEDVNSQKVGQATIEFKIAEPKS